MKITRTVMTQQTVELDLRALPASEWPDEAFAAAKLHVLASQDALKEMLLAQDARYWLATRLERYFEQRDKARQRG